jgi:predicted unusual protein kinase regulating ubiquinone biosynthesis (AarF/ABC1/UbiB family)
MKLKEIYQLAIEMGKQFDPRGDEVNRLLEDRQKEYEKMSNDDRDFFDKETLSNPYNDTRILYGLGEEMVKSLICGIDMETPEIILADRLREKGRKIDLVIAHHPEGSAQADLYNVMQVQSDMMAGVGVPINIAEALMEERIAEVKRAIMPLNHQRAIDAARLLDLPFMCVHSPADNLVSHYLEKTLASTPYRTVQDVLDILMDIPEYQQAKKPWQEIFVHLEATPVAAASLGQVHFGILMDGREVAVKVMRPGIEELITIDLKAIKQVIGLIKVFTDWEKFMDLDAIYQEFEETLRDELDYIKEGHNAQIIAANSKEDQDLLIPEIVWEYTGTRVLTMEYMRGIKITNYDEIEAAGINRKGLAAHLLSIYVRQILIDGFYHADPHPGNLFVSEEGKLIMVDFGMVGAISLELRTQLVDMVKAMVRRDYESVVEYLMRLGFIHYGADRNTISRAVAIFLDHTLGDAQSISETDINRFLQDLEQLLYEQPFQVPARFTFLGRALGTLYGICVGLDPEINFLQVARPYVDEMLGDGGGLFQLVKEKAEAWGSAFIELPPLLERVLQKTERGDLVIRIPLQEINLHMSNNTRSIKALTWAVAFGFTMLTAAYLRVNQFHSESCWVFSLAGLFLILLLINSKTRSIRRRAPHPPVIVKRDK